MTAFDVQLLSAETWSDFARLVEKHNGVWGGCWCLEFHAEGARRDAGRRHDKEVRVRDGTAHAALVYDGGDCVGWCQFGSVDELPRIKRRRAYEAGEVQAPDWRITCFLVDKDHRGRGVAWVALGGALREVARLGGGWSRASPRTSRVGARPAVSCTTRRRRFSSEPTAPAR